MDGAGGNRLSPERIATRHFTVGFTLSRYAPGGAGGFNLLRQWRKNLSTKAKEASPFSQPLRVVPTS
jgi:hypothetical protein